MWHTLVLIMKLSVGSRKLLWPIVLGLFNVLGISQYKTTTLCIWCLVSHAS